MSSYFQQIATFTSCLYIYLNYRYVKSNENTFLRNQDYHNYNTRNNTEITIPTHNSALFERNPNYIGIKCYNRLPSTIKNIKNLRKFKYELQSFLLKRNFYSMSEYFEY